MRLIDADELWELLDNGYGVDLSEVPETKAALLEMINYQETIDAVPVVRCKDCKWYVYSEKAFGHVCRFNSSYRRENDYCSDGERRMENG